MSKQYDDYLMKHKNGVQISYEWIKNNIPTILPLEEDAVMERLEYNINFHDASKYGEEEYLAYDIHFYGDTKTEQSEKMYQKAWLHHIHANPHHWQHWVLINDNPDKGEISLQMPYENVIEMICDWWSFSWREGKPRDIFKWYDEHKDYMKMHEETRKQINDILDKIRNALDEKGIG